MEMVIGVIILCVFGGAFGAEKEDVKQVMAGESVTLPAGPTEEHEIWIIWYQVTGSKEQLIAQQRGNDTEFYDYVKGLKDRLKINKKTGDLTIRNTRPEDSGLYVRQMYIQIKTNSNKTFSVTVRDRLPVPVIIWDCPQNQSAGFSKTKRVAVCSVNVSDGTLSWYRNNDSVSSISLSDHPAVFSLSQEVDSLENNTYMCIVSNSFTNQTTHLNITDLCHHSEPKGFGLYKAVLVAVGAVVAVGLLLVVCCCKDVDKQNKRVLRKIWS